jgi:hypothetical protein
MIKLIPKSLFIIIVNIFPLLGLFYLEWSPFDVLLLFIAETLISLFFFELKVFTKIFKGIFSDLLPAIVIMPAFIFFSFIHITLSWGIFVNHNTIITLNMFSTISASIEKNLYWIFLIFLYQSIYFI